MQRSRQEIVDDGRRHCYLTPPLHVLPGAELWILGDTQKSRLKWVVTRIYYMRKARGSCQGVQGQKIHCHLFLKHHPLLCLCIHLINPDQVSPHLGILFSLFRVFFLLTRHFQQFMLYHCIGATSLSQFYGFFTGKQTKDVTLQKTGGRNASSIMHQCHKIQAFTFWIQKPDVNFYANADTEV